MIPKHIIEKAIEGGWREKMRKIVMEKSYCMLFAERLSTYPTMIYYAEFILDPLFWQALGKSLGWGKETYHTNTGKEWGERFCNHCGISVDIQPSRESGCNHVHYPESCDICLKNSKTWKEQARQFFDLLLSNGNTSAYWESLIK